jgi:two-component system chemotaxis response regulator CheY
MSKKILVVEDSAIMRSLVVSAVEEINGVETVEASNGYEALKALPQHKFDAIITDINMPEMNGLELVRFVKSNDMYKKIPTFIISTDHRESDVKTGLALGADWYFVKPILMEQLKDTVREFLGV